MKELFFVFLIVLVALFASAQKNYLESLHQQLNNSKEDTTRVLALRELGEYYAFNQFDSSIFYAHKTIDFSQKLNYPYGSYLGLRILFFAFNCQGNYPKALEVTLQNYKITEKIKRERPSAFAVVNYFLGVLHREMGNFTMAISQLQGSIQLQKATGGEEADMFSSFCHLALVFQQLKQLDSALKYAQRGFDLSLRPTSILHRYQCLASAVLGYIHVDLGHYDQARKYFSLGIEQSRIVNNTYFLARNYYGLADLLNKIGHPDSCIYYARMSLQLCQEHKFWEYALNASTLLTKIYESQNKSDSTIKYMRIMLQSKDSVLGQSKVKEFQKFVFDDEQRKQEIQQEQEQYKNRIKTYALLSGILVLLLIAFILWRNSKQRQKTNYQLEKAYKELQSTQAQLIQTEKMASLGELTAGIAHEIQNPLNFVNNFSDLSNELLDEMKAELEKGNTQDAMIIVNDVKQNLEKINHHGKRADAIVKGMLQHSQTSTGQKEPTDINKLADEYLRLTYHGLRAKDKSFNTDLKTDFDESIGKINVIPQDIGRVIVNLLTNAFYAVNEKKQMNIEGYEPAVSLSTKKVNDKVEIRVKDNGKGITQKIVEKIFQPFFTTKPTGQGTGLGLSLSYDIIKAHGGEIKVETVEGEESTFSIVLPIV